jgi:hypothetical protein
MISTIVNLPSVMIPRFNQPVGERKHFRRLLLANFGNGTRLFVDDAYLDVASALAATWNLHTIQPRYFATTYSEVINLTILLKTKD